MDITSISERLTQIKTILTASDTDAEVSMSAFRTSVADNQKNLIEYEGFKIQQDAPAVREIAALLIDLTAKQLKNQRLFPYHPDKPERERRLCFAKRPGLQRYF